MLDVVVAHRCSASGTAHGRLTSPVSTSALGRIHEGWHGMLELRALSTAKEDLSSLLCIRKRLFVDPLGRPQKEAPGLENRWWWFLREPLGGRPEGPPKYPALRLRPHSAT